MIPEHKLLLNNKKNINYIFFTFYVTCMSFKNLIIIFYINFKNNFKQVLREGLAWVQTSTIFIINLLSEQQRVKNKLGRINFRCITDHSNVAYNEKQSFDSPIKHQKLHLPMRFFLCGVIIYYTHLIFFVNIHRQILYF